MKYQVFGPLILETIWKYLILSQKNKTRPQGFWPLKKEDYWFYFFTQWLDHDAEAKDTYNK